jgi:hypothetical protein
MVDMIGREVAVGEEIPLFGGAVWGAFTEEVQELTNNIKMAVHQIIL